MKVTQYEALIRAVESGTLTKASAELGYSQSGLTRALNALEDQWGVKLLKRDRSGVRLTAEGEILYPYIQASLYSERKLAEKVNEITGIHEGMIRFGTFNSASAQWLPHIIKRFHESYPRIKFELIHGTDEQVNQMLYEGSLDLGFVGWPTIQKLEGTFLYRDPLVSIFAENDPHAAWEVFPIRELPSLPYISLNEGVEDEITAILAQNNIEPDTRFMESDDHAVIAMVEQGLGTSLMSMMMLQGFDRRIKAVPLDPPAHRDLGIACRSRKELSNAASLFYRTACDWVINEYTPLHNGDVDLL